MRGALDTLVVEARAIGGQAGTSSMIRNYLGFQRGISGGELTYRAFTAIGDLCRYRFGCQTAVPRMSARNSEARAASHHGSQHVELGSWRGRVEAVLDQPAGRR